MKYTVLHVEDDASDRLIISTSFAKMAPSVMVRSAVDGEDAIAYLAGEGAYKNRDANPIPQLILLDLKIPKKSGFEVLQWVKSQPNLKHIPVIVLSSSDDAKDIERATGLGANTFLVKNVDLKVMRDYVKGIGEYAALITVKPVDVPK